MSAVPFWDYRREYETERADVLAAVDAVLRGGRLILGDAVRLFEQEFSAVCGGVAQAAGSTATMSRRRR